MPGIPAGELTRFRVAGGMNAGDISRVSKIHQHWFTDTSRPEGGSTMRIKKSHVAAVSAGVVTVGAIAFGARYAGADVRPDQTTVVDWSIPHHELLDDVLAIEAGHARGAFAFSYVPRTRPDGLRRMLPGTTGDVIVDGYQLGAQPAQIMVEYAGQPTGTCAGVTGDPGSGLCLQQRTLTAATDDSRMRHVTVILSQAGLSAASARDPATAGLRTFWTTTDLVPAVEAGWFTALAAEARAAPKLELG